jgi:hypothetical protein
LFSKLAFKIFFILLTYIIYGLSKFLKKLIARFLNKFIIFFLLASSNCNDTFFLRNFTIFSFTEIGTTNITSSKIDIKNFSSLNNPVIC